MGRPPLRQLRREEAKPSGTRVQHHFKGPGAINFLERVTPSSIAGLPPGGSTYSCFLHPRTGGIVDDIVISRSEYGCFHVVSNAGTREKVHAYITEQLQEAKEMYENVFWDIYPDHGLLALQGPLSAKILEDFLGSEGSGLRFQPNLDVNTFYFGQVKVVTIAGLPNNAQAEVMISRGGYTGEDGFELSIPPAYTTTVAKHLLQAAGPGRLRLAGLGARDSLRLEAGLCLYGQDLDDSTTPVEAAIGWIVHPDRRTDNAGFHGSSVILPQLKQRPPLRRRVGMIIATRPARAGAEILGPNITQPEASKSSEIIAQHEASYSSKAIKQPAASESSEGTEQSIASELPGALEQPRTVIGTVTSGCPSPTLGQNIAMGYVTRRYAKIGTELWVMVGGKERKATVVKMPFVKANRWLLQNTPRPVEHSKPTKKSHLSN